MLNILLAILVSMPGDQPCDINSVCARGDRSASVNLTLTGTLVSSEQLAYETQPTDLNGALVLNTEVITTGIANAITISEKFLIFDNDINPNKEPIQLAIADHGVDISIKEEQYLVIKWPDGYRLPKHNELVAIRDALRDTNRSEVRIASFFKKFRNSKG